MKKSFGIVAAAMLMTSTGAFAQGAQADQPAEKEKKICKSEKVTGSLTRVRRTCLTQRQWDEIAVSHNRALDRLGRSANQAEALTPRSEGGAPAGGGHTF